MTHRVYRMHGFPIVKEALSRLPKVLPLTGLYSRDQKRHSSESATFAQLRKYGNIHADFGDSLDTERGVEYRQPTRTAAPL